LKYKDVMTQIPLYPLRFEPICQYRLWGGRRLSDMMRTPLPGDGPVGEVWILSDRDDFPSRVAEGPLKGYTIQQLREQSPIQLLGNLAGCFRRFPLLLKFLDAREMLSVQVHPSDLQSDYLVPGESGKTEAWVVLEAEAGSHVYAGINPGTNAGDLRLALASRMLANHLASFAPNPGGCVSESWDRACARWRFISIRSAAK
jgi:mannose-6-phosphate isomerase